MINLKNVTGLTRPKGLHILKVTIFLGILYWIQKASKCTIWKFCLSFLRKMCCVSLQVIIYFFLNCVSACAFQKTLESSHGTSYSWGKQVFTRTSRSASRLPGVTSKCKAEDAQVALLVALQRTVLNLLLSYRCKLAGNLKEGTLCWFNYPSFQSYTELFFRIMREILSRNVQDSSTLPVYFGPGVYFELIPSNYIFYGVFVHTEECQKEQMVFIFFRLHSTRRKASKRNLTVLQLLMCVQLTRPH